MQHCSHHVIFLCDLQSTSFTSVWKWSVIYPLRSISHLTSFGHVHTALIFLFQLNVVCLCSWFFDSGTNELLYKYLPELYITKKQSSQSLRNEGNPPVYISTYAVSDDKHLKQKVDMIIIAETYLTIMNKFVILNK